MALINYFLYQTNEDSQAGGGGAASQHSQDLKSEGVQAGGTLTSSKSSATSTRKEHLQHMPKSVDYGDGNESVSLVYFIKSLFCIFLISLRSLGSLRQFSFITN